MCKCIKRYLQSVARATRCLSVAEWWMVACLAAWSHSLWLPYCLVERLTRGWLPFVWVSVCVALHYIINVKNSNNSNSSSRSFVRSNLSFCFVSFVCTYILCIFYIHMYGYVASLLVTIWRFTYVCFPLCHYICCRFRQVERDHFGVSLISWCYCWLIA